MSLATCDKVGKPNISSHCFDSSRMGLLSDFCLDVTSLCLLSKVTWSHFSNSIILLTSLSWTFQNFHYSDSLIMKIHFPSGSDGITLAMNCTRGYILMYTLAVVTQVCIIKHCFVMHFYRWAELIPYFWEFELNILNTLLHTGIIQISRKQIKNGKFPHLVLSLHLCRHLQSWNAYIHNISFDSCVKEVTAGNSMFCFSIQISHCLKTLLSQLGLVLPTIHHEVSHALLFLTHLKFYYNAQFLCSGILWWSQKFFRTAFRSNQNMKQNQQVLNC